MINHSFELDTRTKRKDDTPPPLRVKLYRSRTDYVFVGLRMYYLPEQWDAKRERVVNCVTAVVDNARLNNYRVAIGRLVLEIDESGEATSLSDVRLRVQVALGQKQQKAVTFCAYGAEYAAKVHERRTRDNFFATLKKIRDYDRTDRSFPDITVGWVRGFEMFYLNQGLKLNY